MHTFSRLIGGLAFAAMIGAEARAQDYIDIEVKGELPPELKAAIARVVAPSAFDSEFASSAKRAISLEDLCRSPVCSEGLKAAAEAATGGALPADVAEEVERLQTEAQAGAVPSDAGTVVPTLRLPPRRPAAEVAQDYMLVERDSDLFRAHREALAAAVGDATIAAVPLPETTTAMAEASVEPQDGAAGDLGAVLLDTYAATTIATLERDIGAFGATTRTLPISPDASEEDIAALLQVSRRIETATVARGTAPRNVDIEWPVELSAAGRRCEQSHERWPFDPASVAKVLAFDLKVLAAMGQNHPQRSNILIVDSGISASLAQQADFKPFLFADTRELLSHGKYYLDKTLREPECDDADDVPTANAYGHIPSAAKPDALCISQDPIAHLTPPEAPAGASPFIRGHGGFVAGIAMGGPDMVKSDIGLDRLVGVSFARIMWKKDQEENVRSDAPDVAEAIEYAIGRRADILNASLRVRKDTDKLIVKAIRRYVASGGLVVAAAGNFGAELQQGSQSFPAAIVTSEGDDGLIVVGGLRRRSAGQDDIEHWPDSAWSGRLIDIAAPAADIMSYDMEGGLTCLSGTSAAAPQVSFLAGVLKALGYRSSGEIKRRILATADYSEALGGKVRGGRVLNAANALDVFVDLIWRAGSKTPLRVELLPPAGADDAVILQVCSEEGETLDAVDGWIDAARLISWRRLAEGKAEVWHRTNQTEPITPLDTQCPAGSGEVRYRNLADGTESTLRLDQLDRIVPSRLRAGLPAVRRLAAGG